MRSYKIEKKKQIIYAQAKVYLEDETFQRRYLLSGKIVNANEHNRTAKYEQKDRKHQQINNCYTPV